MSSSVSSTATRCSLLAAEYARRVAAGDPPGRRGWECAGARPVADRPYAPRVLGARHRRRRLSLGALSPSRSFDGSTGGGGSRIGGFLGDRRGEDASQDEDVRDFEPVSPMLDSDWADGEEQTGNKALEACASVSIGRIALVGFWGRFLTLVEAARG
jgi:hypothetical protein